MHGSSSAITSTAIRLERLARTSVKELAALCSRLLAEERVHVEHVDAWIRRLGEGTSESADLLQSALDRLAPHAAMLWSRCADQETLESSGVYPPLSGGVDPYQRWVRELEEVAGSRGPQALAAIATAADERRAAGSTRR